MIRLDKTLYNDPISKPRFKNLKCFSKNGHQTNEMDDEKKSFKKIKFLNKMNSLKSKSPIYPIFGNNNLSV